MNTRLGLLLALAMAGAAGCSPLALPPDAHATALTATHSAVTATPAVAPARTRTPPATTKPAVSSTALTPADTVSDDLLRLPAVEQAKADLALRLSVSPAEIDVVSVQPMTWTDSSMGCPQPDMAYLQVLVEGFLIELSHAGQFYRYHSGGGQPPFLCEPSFGAGKTPPAFTPDFSTPPAPGI